MIYYFSGTGNSRYVAEQLAKRLNDQTISLVGVEEISDDKTIIVVCPIYAWLVPSIVMEFLRKKKLAPDQKLYLALTCGDNVGKAIERVKREISLDGAYSIIMPNNYVIGFDIDPLPEQTEKILKAEGEIKKIAHEISQGLRRERYEKGRFAWYFGSVAGRLFQRFARSTKHFYSQDHCISCGRCARDCPVEAIELIEGRPVWHKPECEMCLGCLHACPVEAIQYGKSTRKKGRYTFEKWQARTK